MVFVFCFFSLNVLPMLDMKKLQLRNKRLPLISTAPKSMKMK